MDHLRRCWAVVGGPMPRGFLDWRVASAVPATPSRSDQHSDQLALAAEVSGGRYREYTPTSVAPQGP
jgi:hypothetical protein